MNLNEFSAMIRDAGLMGMVEAKKVFTLAQKSSVGSASDEDDAVIRELRLAAEKKQRIAKGATVISGKGDVAAGGEANLSAADRKVHALAEKVSAMDGSAYDDDTLMTFQEYLAGLARIGIWKFHGGAFISEGRFLILFLPLLSITAPLFRLRLECAPMCVVVVFMVAFNHCSRF